MMELKHPGFLIYTFGRPPNIRLTLTLDQMFKFHSFHSNLKTLETAVEKLQSEDSDEKIFVVRAYDVTNPTQN